MDGLSVMVKRKCCAEVMVHSMTDYHFRATPITRRGKQTIVRFVTIDMTHVKEVNPLPIAGTRVGGWSRTLLMLNRYWSVTVPSDIYL